MCVSLFHTSVLILVYLFVSYPFIDYLLKLNPKKILFICSSNWVTVKPRKLEHPQGNKIGSNNQYVQIYRSQLLSIAYFLGSG